MNKLIRRIWRSAWTAISRYPTRVALSASLALVGLVAIAAFALLGLGSTWYSAAMTAVGSCATVAAIGLAAVGLAADHSRQRSSATFEFVNSVLDLDESHFRAVQAWLKASGVTNSVGLSREQAQQLRSNDQFGDIFSAARSYLNHIERLAYGVRCGIFDDDVVRNLAFSRIVNARHNFREYIVLARESKNAKGLTSRFYEHLEWLVDEHWKTR